MRSKPVQNDDAGRRLFGVFLLAATLLFSSCTKQSARKVPVARVGTAELTQEELQASQDSSGTSARPSGSAITEWVINELLFQEAVRRGITSTEDFQRRVDAVKKRLAIAALLEREIFSIDDSILVPEGSVDSAFKEASKDYTLHEDVACVSFALFSDRDAANTFRSLLLRGTPWQDALHKARKDSTLRPHFVQAANRQYFTQAMLYPQELWKLARTLGREEVSFVVRTDAGFYVLKAHGLKHQGEIPDFDYVRNDVRQRLAIEERRTRYEKFVADLRTRRALDIRMERTDTTTSVED